MPKSKKTTAKKANQVEVVDENEFKIAAKKSIVDQLKDELRSSQSYSNLILGLIIVLVIGILLLNYFKKTQSELGSSSQSDQTQTKSQSGDVDPNNLPGNYTIKEGDTLFSIAQKYYQDGYQYPKLVQANNLTNENTIEVGQTIIIPKLDITPTPSIESPTDTPTPQQ